jgi:hypothetical protein
MSADECSTNHAMKTFVDLSDPIKNTTKGSAILQPTSLIDTPKLHPSACNQQGNSPAVSNLHPRTLTPRYMSPTIASISQASTASTAQVETRNTTPTQGLAPLKAPKARSWFTTALSLSGIGRPSDGGPRSKKERAISHSVDSIKDRGLSEPKRPSKVFKSTFLPQRSSSWPFNVFPLDISSWPSKDRRVSSPAVEQVSTN